MNCLTEVLGMGLPGNGTIPAAYQGARIALAKRAGAKIMDLVAQNLCPRDIMTMDAFENAITVDMAIGGSSNTALHLPAIAHEADLELPLELFDEISKKTPYLTKLSPGGSHHIIDLNEAGGINAVMHELSKLDLIHKGAKSHLRRSASHGQSRRRLKPYKHPPWQFWPVHPAADAPFRCSRRQQYMRTHPANRPHHRSGSPRPDRSRLLRIQARA